ncbi:hypothetical protein HaLaN_33159, partial [Haematococcus lacustris]
MYDPNTRMRRSSRAPIPSMRAREMDASGSAQAHWLQGGHGGADIRVRGPAPVHSGDTTSSDWQVMDLEEMEGRVEALLANGKKQSFLPVYESVAARLSANQRKQLVWFRKLGTAVSKLRTTSLGVI